MQFNDVSGQSGLVQEYEEQTGLDLGTVSGNTAMLKSFTRRANIWLRKVGTMILAAQDDWDWDDLNNSDFPIATTPMIAGKRFYTFPTTLGILKIKRVDFTYDGVNYYRANPVDSQQISRGLGNDTNTDANFNKNEPYYDPVTNSLFIYPEASAADVTAGALIRVEYSRDIVPFTYTMTTQEPGFDPAFHFMIAAGPAYEYCRDKRMGDKKADLLGMLQDGEARIKQFYGSKDTDRQYVAKPANVNMK